MKVFAVLILAYFVTAAQAKPSQEFPQPLGAISNNIENALINFRDEMPNGFPELGIPPLAPLQFARKDLRLSTDSTKFNLSVSDFSLFGLNDFDIKKCKLNLLAKKFSLHLIFNKIVLQTNYDLSMWAKKHNITLEVIGAGPAEIKIFELDVQAIIKFKYGLISGQPEIKSVDYNVDVQSISTNIQGLLGNGKLNKRLNSFLSYDLVDLIRDNNKDLNAWLQPDVLNVVKELMAQKFVRNYLSSVEGQALFANVQ